MADTHMPPKDPIVYGSLSRHLVIASVFLALATLWAFYDEIVAKRPWKSYQKDFVARYVEHLESVKADVVAIESGLVEDDQIKGIAEQIALAEEQTASQVREIDERASQVITPRILKLTKAMQGARSEVMALTYKLEHAEGKNKAALEEELESVKQRDIIIEDVVQLDGTTKTQTLQYHSLAAALDEAKAIKADLIRQRAALTEPARLLRKDYEKAMRHKRPGLSSEQIDGLIRKMNSFKVEVKQIYVPDPIGLVDRCESCHLGIREPLELTAEDFGGPYAEAFVSHPERELLDIHDPDQFGCTPCHGGNGAATISVKEGHGKIKHWLWPMYDRENTEAGCLQCHETSLVLDHADTLNAGKELFRYRGCWGCHPREGFDVERSLQRKAAQAVRTAEAQIEEMRFAQEKQIEIADSMDATEEELRAALTKIPEYTLRISGLESELIELQRRETAFGKQLKNVGPSLRVVKQKLRPEWITQWIENPRGFRPTTRMPVFRLPDEHLKAIAAAVWQAADAPDVPKHEPGDAAHGKELFEARGCLGCHSLGSTVSGWFAPELSRVGEKVNYDYIVEWVKDTPDWSLMPNLRLTLDDARDIASYLMEQKREDASYDDAYAHLEDTSLRQRGEMLIRHYGCAGCHDIAGFENVGKIGTDLTTEGNKPIERLSFALHTQPAKRNTTGEGIQYNHKSFFEHELKKPEYFDEGMLFESDLEKSRMPNFGLAESEVTQLVTFLLGSVDSDVPEQLEHHPVGRVKDIIDGWWVIKKYNCMGCHQFTPDHAPDIQKLPQFQGEGAVFAPPSLVGVGARLNPEWLAKFLRNPAMRATDLNRNGVRSYLKIRMPTFNLWDEEIGALVRFFEAMSNQTLPYFPPPYPELTEHELKLAREAFLSANCLKCHASAEQGAFDPNVIAPSFVHVRERLKPSWTERWLLDPAKLMIGTRMPQGLFRQDGQRQVVAGAQTDELAAYDKDHAKLFVRYMNQIDSSEAAFLEQIKDAEKAAAPAVEEEEFFDDEDE